MYRTVEMKTDVMLNGKTKTFLQGVFLSWSRFFKITDALFGNLINVLLTLSLYGMKLEYILLPFLS